MDKKTLFIGLAGALLLVGGVFAADLMNKGKMGNRGKGCIAWGNATSELDLAENATIQEIREAMFQKQLKDLGLTEDSTIKEYRAALESKRQALVRERLGLDADATETEIEDALEAKRNVTQGMGMRGRHAGTMIETLGREDI